MEITFKLVIIIIIHYYSFVSLIILQNSPGSLLLLVIVRSIQSSVLEKTAVVPSEDTNRKGRKEARMRENEREK